MTEILCLLPLLVSIGVSIGVLGLARSNSREARRNYEAAEQLLAEIRSRLR